MAELLGTFREKAEGLIAAINEKGGISATIAGLRQQMAVADRRRAIGKVRSQLKRLDRQITEMITAVGVQAVGLHKAGTLSAPELEPLCHHIVELEAAVAQQKTALARLESMTRERPVGSADLCPACGKAVLEGGTFCPHCGAAAPKGEGQGFCAHCGASLRSGARFCAKCGRRLGDADNPQE